LISRFIFEHANAVV